MKIDYDHSLDFWKLDSSRAVLPHVFEGRIPPCLLDVGCGPGTWLKAAVDLGVGDVLGVDGVSIPEEKLFVPKGMIRQQDISQPWNLERVFDVALCLEVAEHLDPQAAAQLIKNLVVHANTIVFSAAIPGQPGYHHVNCQWPVYWQELFNREGFVCNDAIRWKIWTDARIEPWYRQNLFIAHREPDGAGKEKRLAPVIHPEILPHLVDASKADAAVEERRRIERGSMSVPWYLTTLFSALGSKLARRLKPGQSPR